MKRIYLYFSFIFIVILLLPIGISLILPIYYRSDIKTLENHLKPVQCALVLGASVTSKKEPSPALKERLEKALELYRSGKVQKIIVSGDNSKLYYDEVSVMKNYLLRKKVRSQDIFMDHAGVNTWNSILHTKYIYGAKNTIIVTQRYHLTRALMIADLIHLNAYGYAADMGLYNSGWSSEFREFFARIKDITHILFFQNYNFENVKKYNITGNGKETWNRPE